MAKQEIIAEAEKLGIKLTGEETVAQLTELIEQAKVAQQPSLNQSEPQEHQNTGSKPAAPIAFDISKLTPTELVQLKAMLAETPERQTDKGHTITVRRFNEKYVIGVGTARTRSVLDPIEQKPITKVTIPVLYLGADSFEDADYKEFMQSERVKCKVESTREIKDREVHGIVYSMELKREVEQVVNTCVRYYKVTLPTGEQIELFEDAVNL